MKSISVGRNNEEDNDVEIISDEQKISSELMENPRICCFLDLIGCEKLDSGNY